MRQHYLYAAVLAVGFLAMPSPAAAQQQQCNPPKVTCDAGDGITYRCPPCRPRLRSDAQEPPASTLEGYRESLEGYRTRLEDNRARDPGGSLEGYRKGIESYREGMEDYRETQAAVRAADAG